ncbi:MAG: hypothetical protein KC621_32985, partial [Myxococcales bacterium]|nr:hypothetical protein [Myxococcales bacterium]
DADSDADTDLEPGAPCTVVLLTDLGSDGVWDREGVDVLDPADPERLLSSERGPLGGPPDDVWTWTWDAVGRPLHEVHEVDGVLVSQARHVYIGGGSSEALSEDLDGDGVFERLMITTWEDDGTVSRVWDYDGDQVFDRYDTLTEDEAGRLTAVMGTSDPDGQDLIYQELHQYDGPTGLSGVSFYDLDGVLPAEEMVRRTYDAAGRPLSRALSTGAPRFSTRVEDEDWSWDGGGHLVRHRTRTWGVDVSGADLNFYTDEHHTLDAEGRTVRTESELGLFLDLGPIQQTTPIATDLTLLAPADCP